jgi:hypothetical protein
LVGGGSAARVLVNDYFSFRLRGRGEGEYDDSDERKNGS